MDNSIWVMVRRILGKWWIIAICAAIGFAYGYNETRGFRPVYSAQTTVLGLNMDYYIENPDIVSEFVTVRRITSELMEVYYSDKVAQEASDRLMAEYGIYLPSQYITAMISISNTAGSNLTTVKASSTVREYVAPVSNVVSEAFISVVQSMTQTSYFQVLDPARPEAVSKTAGGDKATTCIIWTAAGFAVALAGVYVWVMFDKRIKNISDVVGVPGADNIIPIPMHNIK